MDNLAPSRMVDLRDIVARLGGDLYAGGRAATVPGPGHSRRDRSLSLTLCETTSRVVFFSHAGDSARDCMMHLGIEARHSDSRSSREERAKFKRRMEEEQRREAEADRLFCRTVWDQTVPLTGTPAETYLFSRELILEGCGEVRFHPAAPRSKRPPAEGEEVRTCPAMVAIVRLPDGKPVGLHATYLTPEGRKAFGAKSKLMFGRVAGGVVWLAPPAPVLAVSEGIESGASYSALKGVPCWPALSTAGLNRFSPPLGVRKLVVAADGDPRGMEAAVELAGRVSRRCDVEIHAAPDGKDWNDVLVEGGHV